MENKEAIRVDQYRGMTLSIEMVLKLIRFANRPLNHHEPVI